MTQQDFKKRHREICALVADLQKKDANEAETRRRVERIMESACGYDPFKHLTREHAVQGAGDTEYIDFVIKSKPNHIDVAVELKRVNIDLQKKHLKQATRYATDLGCEWILLTNIRQWELHHLEFGQPPEVRSVMQWDLMHDPIEKVEEGFETISLKNIRKSGLQKLWARKKALTSSNMLSALLSESVLMALRKALRKEAGEGPLPYPEDVVAAIRKQLNDNALRTMDKIKISLPPKKAIRKRSVKKDTPQPPDNFSPQPAPPETPRPSEPPANPGLSGGWGNEDPD